MATMEMHIVLERRRAIYTPGMGKPELGLTAGVPVECRVHGCFQITEVDSAEPYFIIELEDGHCTYALPHHIQFIKEDANASYCN